MTSDLNDFTLLTVQMIKKIILGHQVSDRLSLTEVLSHNKTEKWLELSEGLTSMLPGLTSCPLFVASSPQDILQHACTNLSAHTLYSMQDLKATLPGSFNTIVSMPGKYHTTVDPNVALVWHAQRRVPTELWEEIEAQLHMMVTMGIITHGPTPTAWISSLTYPRKASGCICTCQTQRVLTKQSSLNIIKPQHWMK